MTVARPDHDLVVELDDAPSVTDGIDLRRHVSRLALEWDDDAPDRRWQQVDASLVFADISGFTALTEKLATRGRIGAEELIETLNRVFGAMLEQAALRGGELLKFGGDALLFVFRGDDHPFRACRSAVDMRQALKEAAKTPTSVGRLRLSMSVGIHSGPVDFFLVGAPTRELLILGPAATATAEAEHAAVAGEILLTADTAAHLPPRSTVEREDGLHRLRWRFTYPPEGEGPPTPVVTPDQLLTLFPVALGQYLDDAVPDPEHKVATIGFARFSGTDTMLREQGHAAVADALHGTVSVVEDALIAEGVTLLATDLDSDGGKLFMGSGVPYSSEDDEGRMLRAMRRVLDVGTPLPMQIGVNRGHVFAAEVGTRHRAAYSAMGDTTNTAARIMSKAPTGVLFAHPTVLEQSRTLFATETAGPFPMKGKAEPVLVFGVGEERGTRAARGGTSRPLVGRETEVGIVRAALTGALSGEGGVVTVSAPTGLGKSRLLTEALAGLEATVVTVRAEPYGMVSPYRMLRDPVRAAFGVERGDPDEMAAALVEAVRRRLPDDLPMAPLLSDVVHIALPDTPEASAIEPRFRPDRIADLVVRVIESSVRGPFVLLVEEGHWADSSSITVLRRVAEATAGRPWAVLVARRSDAEGYLPDQGTLVDLQPLRDDIMRRIVLDATDDAPLRPHEVDGIVARAQGNPLFAEELVRVFREVGSLDAMPESLHAALDAQVDALDPHARRILRYASVLGRSFRREVLNETVRSDDLYVDQEMVEHLGQYLEPDGPARLVFRNSMIRDAAYNGLAYRTRAKLHAAAGRAVEKLSTDLESDSDTLSLHFWRGGDDERTWRYARLAADRAAKAYANVEAGVQYERALDAARHLKDAVGDEQRLDVLTRLGDVRDLGGLYEESIEAYRMALRLGQGDRENSVAMLLAMARVRQRVGSYRAALTDLTRAERMLDGDTSLAARRERVRLHAMRVLIRQSQERLAEAQTEARRVVAEARAAGESDALERALMTIDVVASSSGDTDMGAGTAEALRSALKHGRLQRANAARCNLGAFAFVAGRWDEAVDYYLAARRTAQEIGDVVYAAFVGLNLGELFVNRGELDEAEAALADTVRVLRVAGRHGDAAWGAVQQARVMLARGDAVGAERLAEDVEIELAALGQPVSALEATLARAEALTAQGRPLESLDLVALAHELLDGEGAGLVTRARLAQARALIMLDRRDEARTLLDEGLAQARTQGQRYEEAQLVLLRQAIEPDSSADEQARATLASLGVKAPD